MAPNRKKKPRLFTFVLDMRHQEHMKIKSTIQHHLFLPTSTLHHKLSVVGRGLSRAQKLRTSSTVGQPVS